MAKLLRSLSNFSSFLSPCLHNHGGHQVQQDKGRERRKKPQENPGSSRLSDQTACDSSTNSPAQPDERELFHQRILNFHVRACTPVTPKTRFSLLEVSMITVSSIPWMLYVSMAQLSIFLGLLFWVSCSKAPKGWCREVIGCSNEDFHC